ncbi:PTS fructose transporter subunit IIB, partial [Enterococcus entomosocium]
MAKYRLIAATGCPTGIAHTYMAQEALEQAAKKKGISIKVETHGQVGVENQLTEQEIIEAEAVIIAADKDVQSERFAGKRIIDVSVSKGIKEADQLIAAVLNGEGVISEKIERAEGDKEKQHVQQSVGHEIYKNLMNGVS